jgi:hypothetical protein
MKVSKESAQKMIMDKFHKEAEKQLAMYLTDNKNMLTPENEQTYLEKRLQEQINMHNKRQDNKGNIDERIYLDDVIKHNSDSISDNDEITEIKIRINNENIEIIRTYTKKNRELIEKLSNENHRSNSDEINELNQLNEILLQISNQARFPASRYSDEAKLEKVIQKHDLKVDYVDNIEEQKELVKIALKKKYEKVIRDE